MSKQDTNLLMEYIVKTQLGCDLVPLASILIRNSTLNMNELVLALKDIVTEEQIKNSLVVLIKHNLVNVAFNEFENTNQYTFDETECLLRLSFPRYMALIEQNSSNEKSSEIELIILREIFLNGSLTREEIPIIAKKKLTPQKDQVNDETLILQIEKAIDDLTLNYFLAGTSNNIRTINSPYDKSEAASKAEKPKRKREFKAIEKDQVRAPIKVNFYRFLAEERKQSIYNFAQAKFASGEAASELQVLKLMMDTDPNFIQSLIPFIDQIGNHSNSQNQGSSKNLVNISKLNCLTPSEITTKIQQTNSHQKISESQVQQSLDILVADQGDFILKCGFDPKTQQGLYAVNWTGAFKNVQLCMIEQIVAQTLGQHHCRIIRVLTTKGYLEEKEITKMCLLPQKNIRSLLNRLISEGYVLFQDVPLKSSQTGGNTAGGVLMYGVNLGLLRSHIGLNILKTTLNVLLKQGSLGYSINLTLEMNHLNL